MKLMATATLLTGAIVSVYAAFLSGTSLWLISNARGATAALLVLRILRRHLPLRPWPRRARASPQGKRLLAVWLPPLAAEVAYGKQRREMNHVSPGVGAASGRSPLPSAGHSRMVEVARAGDGPGWMVGPPQRNRGLAMSGTRDAVPAGAADQIAVR